MLFAMNGKIYAAQALVLLLAARTFAQVYQTNVVGIVNVNPHDREQSLQ